MNLDAPGSQADFVRLTGLDPTAVSRLVGTVLAEGDTLLSWNHAIIRRRGEEAAGRAGGLAGERERVARAQAERIERENAVRLGRLLPVEDFTTALADIAAQAVPILEALPGNIRMRAPDAPIAVIKVIEEEVVRLRNLWAALQPRASGAAPGAA